MGVVIFIQKKWVLLMLIGLVLNPFALKKSKAKIFVCRRANQCWCLIFRLVVLGLLLLCIKYSSMGFNLISCFRFSGEESPLAPVSGSQEKNHHWPQQIFIPAPGVYPTLSDNFHAGLGVSSEGSISLLHHPSLGYGIF